VPPSAANFVLARMPGRDLGPVAAGLRKRGVLVRHFRAWPDALRISIGTQEEMAALFKVLAPLAADLMASRRNGRAQSQPHGG
jgi:histidinol-phosphate aminotransferase